MHTVHGNKFFMEFHRDQSLVCLFSISFCVAYFTSSKESQQPVTLMIPHLIIVLTEQNDLVIKEIENFPKFFLNGLTLTTCK